MTVFSLAAVRDHLSRRETSSAYQLALAGVAGGGAGHQDVQEAVDEIASSCWNAAAWHLTLTDGTRQPELDSYTRGSSICAVGGVWSLVCGQSPFPYSSAGPDAGGSAAYDLANRLTTAELSQLEARVRGDITAALLGGKKLKGKALYRHLFAGVYEEAGSVLTARAVKDDQDAGAQAILMGKHYRLLRPLADAQRGPLPQFPLLAALAASDWAAGFNAFHSSDKQGKRLLALRVAAALEGVPPTSPLVQVAEA